MRNQPPILIDCEGSNQPGHLLGPHGLTTNLYMCTMCGVALTAAFNRMPDHQRQDILAMINRGDFNE